MAKIMVGEPIPLALKLFDNAPDKKVRARIYSQFGELVEQTYLYHVEDGLYMSTEIKMPNVPSISVVYSVENSEDYSDTAEQFFSAPKVQEEENWVTGIVKSVENKSEYRTGIVYEVKNIESVR